MLGYELLGLVRILTELADENVAARGGQAKIQITVARKLVEISIKCKMLLQPGGDGIIKGGGRLGAHERLGLLSGQRVGTRRRKA